MVIGIPKEIMRDEARVAATPETVSTMIGDGNVAIVEKGAGEGAFFSDERYAEAGARIAEDCEEVYAASDVILKVKEPLYNAAKGKHEIDMMRAGQCVITFIHPASPANREMVEAMAKKGVVGITLDGIPRISRAQSMDALSSMSACAGYKGMLMAANDILKFMPLMATAAGVIRPCNVLVIGAGVAGLRAIATAKALGAVVYAADIRPEAAEQAGSLGAKIAETGVPAELAVAPDGKSAMRLSDEWLRKEREALAERVANSDIVFCSALLLGRVAPILVTEEMVKSMRPGSAIVDISIDQGGNCEITEPGVRTVKHGVVLEGIKNIPGQLAVSSTLMFAKNICNLLRYLTKDGKIALDRNDEIVRGALVTYGGEIVHKGAREAMGL